MIGGGEDGGGASVYKWDKNRPTKQGPDDSDEN